MQDKYQSLKNDLRLFEDVKEVGIQHVCDSIYDTDIEINRVARNFLFKEMHIPVSYYQRASIEHQKEILEFAVRSKPDLKVNVVEDAGNIYAAGPAGVYNFSEVYKVLDDLPGTVTAIDGNLFDSGTVRVYKSVDSNIKEKFSYGAYVTITALFSNGFSIAPTILELVCTNGLMDRRDISGTFKLLPFDCSYANISEAGSLVDSTIRARMPYYEEMLQTLLAAPPAPIDRLIDQLTTMSFPISYIKKMQPTLLALEEGSLKIEVLPEKMESLMDQLSVLSFGAQAFPTATRSRIESMAFDMAMSMQSGALTA